MKTVILGITLLLVFSVTQSSCWKEQIQENTKQYNVIVDEDRNAFIKNQIVKDYTFLYDEVIEECECRDRFLQDPEYEITWFWRTINGDCDSNYVGLCSATKLDSIKAYSNARCFFIDDKLVIIPTNDENGFTDEGYLIISQPVEVENDTIIIREGIYAAFYDEKYGKYMAVAVDVL